MGSEDNLTLSNFTYDKQAVQRHYNKQSGKIELGSEAPIEMGSLGAESPLEQV